MINCREKACHVVQAQAPSQRHRGSFISPGAGRGTSLSEPGRYLRVPGLVCFGVSPSVIGAEEKYPQQNKRGANDGHGPAASTKTDGRGACPEQPRWRCSGTQLSTTQLISSCPSKSKGPIHKPPAAWMCPGLGGEMGAASPGSPMPAPLKDMGQDGDVGCLWMGSPWGRPAPQHPTALPVGAAGPPVPATGLSGGFPCPGLLQHHPE